MDFTSHLASWEDWPQNGEREKYLRREGEESFDDAPQDEPWGPTVLVAAGFRPDELAELRRGLDAAGASDVPLLPGTPAVLGHRVSKLDSLEEPAWSEALPPELANLNGTGGPKALLASGLDVRAQFQLWSLLQSVGLGRICLAMVGPDDLDTRVSILLSRAVEDERSAEAEHGPVPMNWGSGGGWNRDAAPAWGMGSDGFDPGMEDDTDGDEDEGESDSDSDESRSSASWAAMLKSELLRENGVDRRQGPEAHPLGSETVQVGGAVAEEPGAEPGSEGKYSVSREAVERASKGWNMDIDEFLADAREKGFDIRP